MGVRRESANRRGSTSSVAGMAHRDEILVAVDGSATALGAARWAALQAADRGQPLAIASVAESSAVRARAEGALAQAAETARAVLAPGHEVQTELLDGAPIPLLIERSRAAGTIVVGDRGLGDSPVIGSVTEALTSHGLCPAVIIREWTGSEATLGSGPVVVGVDGSRSGEGAVGLAMAQAASRRARLVAVHAWSDLPLDDAAQAADGVGWDSLQQRHDAALAEALAGWQEQFPDVEVERVVVNDRPVRHLLSAGEGAQLMVVGRRGGGGFEGMLVGSTSRALLHTASCPLMIVRDLD